MNKFEELVVNKLDEIRIEQVSQGKDISQNSKDLQIHMKRADLLEEIVGTNKSEHEAKLNEIKDRIRPLEVPWYSKIFTKKNISWFLGIVGAGVGVYATISKYFV